jgi:hypothetical protein
MKDELGHFDLAFVVDTTGSMGPFIKSAQSQMITLLRTLASASEIGVQLRAGIVEYRDHPPQDNSFVTRVHRFSLDMDEVQKAIDTLKANGGGDTPEAVYDGVVAAVRKLDWRAHSHRIAILVGDARPHGYHRESDSFPDGCPCGETIPSVTSLCEEARITLHALALERDALAPFTELTQMTGGQVFSSGSNQAIDELRKVLSEEFGGLELDSRVLQIVEETPEALVDDIAQRAGTGRVKVAQSLSRLGRRGFLG